MKIDLTKKELFAIYKAGIRCDFKRKFFGTHGITKKIYEQMKGTISEKEYEKFKAEWVSIINPEEVEREKLAEMKKLRKTKPIRKTTPTYKKPSVVYGKQIPSSSDVLGDC